MLREILRILNDDGYFSISQLAEKINSSPGAAEGALQQLIRMGYIKKEETGESCTTFCGSCPYAQQCSKEVINTYEITSRGKELL